MASPKNGTKAATVLKRAWSFFATPLRLKSSSTNQPWKIAKMTRSTMNDDPTRSMLNRAPKESSLSAQPPKSSYRAKMAHAIEPAPTVPKNGPSSFDSARGKLKSSFERVTCLVSVVRVAKYGSKNAEVKNCIPTTSGSIGSGFGFERRSSLRKPAKRAAQLNSRLNTPSNIGWTTGAKGKLNNGLTKKKLSDKSKTSFQVRSSNSKAFAPGRIPLLKNTTNM
mmetsp:Transcript_31615/g.46884  ORF Transcript_31615/g.46884 Transcript_31615/m.46884 type:complete len:223 (+) Transcript_31615:335-1003(+)